MKWETPLAAVLIALLSVTSVGILSTVAYAQQEKYFFELHIAVGVEYERTAEVLVNEFPKIGIKLNAETVDWTAIFARVRTAATTGQSWKEGGFDMFMVGLYGAAFEPSGMARYFHTKSQGAFNVWNYYNPFLDELFDEAIMLSDIEKRAEIYREASRLIYEDQPVVVMNYPSFAIVTRAEIEGIKPYTCNQPIASPSFWQLTENGKPIDLIRAAAPTDIRTPNVLFDWTGPGYEKVGATVFDSLVEIDESFKPYQPCLAKSWEWSEDLKTITFHLRDDVNWHDGVKFTSADIKFTYEAIMNSETGAEHYSKFLSIESIENPDDYTVVVRLKAVQASFLLDVGTVKIVPKHIFEGVPFKDIATHPYSTGEKMLPGTGPFKLVKWERDDMVELEANSEYFKGKPSVARLIWKILPDPTAALSALEAGDIDLLSHEYAYTKELSEIAKNPKFKIVQWPSLVTEVLGFNTAHPILQNKWVRWAISTIFPRKYIEELAYGTVTSGSQFLTPKSWGYNPDLPEIEYNVEKAKEYMERAGYRYEWLLPTVISWDVYILPAIIGLTVGAVVGALVMKIRKK